MLFSLVVHSAPYSSQGSYTAYQFAIAVLQQGHRIHRVFFYQDGVQTASVLSAPPQDEINLHQLWQDLAKTKGLDVVVCIAAALRRGVLDEREATRYGRSACNLGDGFVLSGLGQLVEAAATSDRLISFG